MKKIISTSLALIVGTLFIHAQGVISLQETTAGAVVTNGATIGEGTGSTTAFGYIYDVLDMTTTAWAGLSANQQADFTAGNDLLINPSDVSLWTDSGVTGVAASLTKGGISALGGSVGSAAANWAAPTSNLTPSDEPTAYYTASSYDYYIVVGWSVNLGSSWATMSGEISNSTLPTAGWFGETRALYNYAGGSGLGAPNVFSPQAATQLPGSGVGAGPFAAPSLTLLPIPVPEPAILALGALGGLSMLLFRRRKG